MSQSSPLPARRRRWPIFAPLGLVLILAVGWSIFWYVAAQRAEETIEGWRAREAQSGRVYTCGRQTVGGYPFRIEVNCTNAVAEVRNVGAPLRFKLANIHLAGQIYDPTLLISEFVGPLAVGDIGQPASVMAYWKLAQASARGTPRAPERLSLVLDEPRFDRVAGTSQQTVGSAKALEMHGRIASGTVTDNPVIDVVFRVVSGLAPTVHPLLGAPTDADVSITLRGLKDFAPQSWAQRLRELQARDGRLDVTRARIQQGDVLATAAGLLGLTSAGNLEGQLDVTIAGIDKVLKSLSVDATTVQGGASGQLGAALGALDRISPMLGNFARQNAGPAIAAGLRALGKQTTLEGREATTLPLRFTDGAVSLGPIPLGRVVPLF